MNQETKKKVLSGGITYLAAFALPTYIMLVILRSGDFYPFGDKTLFIMDMRDQYLEFLAYLRSMTSGDNSIFFSWSRSMGGNFLGLYAYYLASPLSLLVNLFPLEKMDGAIVLLTVIKIGLCGVSFAVYGNYLWKRDKREAANKLALWIFSTSYALISYNMVYSMCLMWLDGVILLPAVLLGVEKILDGSKGLHYTLALAAVFLCNYYIGYMVGIFTAMYFLYRFCCKITRKTAGTCILQGVRFGLCTIFATALSAPLLLPAVKDLLQGKLTGDSGYHFEFTPNFTLADFLGKFQKGAYDSITDSGLPSVYCGLVVLGLAIFFFICVGISLREKIGAFLIAAILTLSFYYSGLNLAWHGFRAPIWFPFRYAFLFSFFMIYMAFRATLILCSADKEGKLFSQIRDGVLAALLILAAVDLTSNGQVLFAGLDGQFGYVSTENYNEFIDKTKPLVEWIRQQDNGLYRMEATYEYSKNDAMLLGYNGMTHYSSTYNQAVNSLTKKLGIAQGHIWNSGYGSSPLLDSLFAVAYKLSDRQEPGCYVKIMDEGKGAAGYQNSLALPMVYSASVSSISPDMWAQNDPYINQNTFLNAIAGKNESYFKELQYEYEEFESGWRYSFMAETADPLYLYMYAGNGGWANVYVNDVWFGNYFSTETTCSLYIGCYAPGQQVEVRVEPVWSGACANGAVIASLNMDVLCAALNELRAGGMKISSHSGGKIRGTISVQENQMVMTSIPYDEGWSVWVDGKKVDLVKFAETFLAVDVPTGEHEIYFSYVSPGFYAGVIVFMAGLMGAICYFVKPARHASFVV